MSFTSWFLKFLTARNKPAQHYEGVSYQDSLLRFTFDAYMSEYESVRREIELRLKLQDQAVNYLFVITAAVITATEVFGRIHLATISFLDKYPEAFLIFAIMMLYFPHLIIKNSYYIAVLGAYENNVISPKIDAIARILPARDANLQRFSKWEKDQFPEWLSGGVLRWDDYRSRIMFSGSYAIVSGLLSIFDNIVVFLPSITFFLIFALEQKVFEKKIEELGLLAFSLVIFYIIICLTLVVNMAINGKVYVGISKIEKGKKRQALLPEE